MPNHKKLSDEDKAVIKTLYIEGNTQTYLANMFNVSVPTIGKVVNNKDDELLKRLKTKKDEEIALDMVSFMDSKRYLAQDFIFKCLNELLKPEKLSKARLTEITTALGTIYDKFAPIPDMSNTESSNLIEAISQQAKNIYDKDDTNENSD